MISEILCNKLVLFNDAATALSTNTDLSLKLLS